MQKSKLQFNIQSNENVKFFHFTLSFFILIFTFFIFAVPAAHASETSGTIVSGGNNGYAWSNQVGWVNFGAANGNIQITDAGITGYAWNTNYGWINMSPTNGNITIAASGALSGSAWGSGVGWINFSGVSINSSGRFVGQTTGSIIGTLTFDCANCFVSTDFRAQNFRTVATTQTPTTAVPGGGGTTASAPSHVTSNNFSLSILPTQTGFLEKTVSQNRKITIDIPKNIFSKKITIAIDENPLVEGVNSALLPQNIDLVNSAFYDITATDENNNFIKSFSDYLTITLPIPFELRSFSDIGVYWLDEGAGQWKRVADISLSESNATASFRVNHLTKFGIFRAVEGLKEQLSVPFAPEIIKEIAQGKTFEEAVLKVLETIGSIATPFMPAEIIEGAPPLEGEATTTETVVSENVSGAGESLAPAQLFDINLEIENTKITNIKELVARMIFTSFGRVPTPVDLTFDILNESGDKIYGKTDKITVRTQEVLTERFMEVENEPALGKYTLLVTTLYNIDVSDEFRQDFEIVGHEEVKAPFWKSVWFWAASTMLLIMIFIIIIKRMKEDEDEKQ